MNITREITPAYYATCDICDNAGPKSFVLADAVTIALDEGWEVTLHWNGLQHVSCTKCPRCSRTIYEAIHDKAGSEPQYKTDPTGEEAPGGPQ